MMSFMSENDHRF